MDCFCPFGVLLEFLYIKAADDVLFLSRVTISVRSAASLHHARLRFKRSILCWKGEGVWEDTLTRQRVRGYIHIRTAVILCIIEFLRDSIKSTRTTDVYFYLFAILTSWRVQALNEIGGVTEEEGIAGGSADHRKHCQPHIRQRLRREPSVTDAKHVRHGFEKCPRVLLQPKWFLSSLF